MSGHTTPEDRQEVAAKLREAARELDGDSTSSIRSAFCAIDHIIGTQDTGRTFEPFFDRLADLIDPTCKPCERWVLMICSRCGKPLNHRGFPVGYYCPHCGARVVIEDA